MLFNKNCTIFLKKIIVLFLLINSISASFNNISCYQCIKNNEEECDITSLKSCNSSFSYDRCAIHINKDTKNGLIIRRECALGPCNFEDKLMEITLGMNCNKNKESYFCTICCKGNGCNKNAAFHRSFSFLLALFGILITQFFSYSLV